MRRGEVWWAAHPAGETHPVLLLSWDAHGDWRNRITIADVTTHIRGVDAEVLIGPDEGMPNLCVVNLDSLATVHRDLLQSPITTLPSARMAEVKRAIHLALGLTLPCRAG